MTVLPLSAILDENEIIPAGSQIQAEIQARNVVLPVDQDFTVTQVLEFMNAISPSLDGKYIAKVSTDLYRVIKAENPEVFIDGPFTHTKEELRYV
jgi:hypothetical protein